MSASRLDAETSLAPMPPLGIVPVGSLSVACSCVVRAAIVVVGSWGELEAAGARGVGVPDGVVCPQADPLGDGAVLLLSLCKLLLGAEGLLGL